MTPTPPKTIKIIRAVTVAQSVTFFKPIVPKLQQLGYEVVSLTSPGDELAGLRQMGVKTVEVKMQRRISPVSDIKSLWQIYRAIRHEKPTIVHSMTPKAGLLCMMASWAARVPVRIHTFTGLVFPTATGIKRKVLMLTDAITCACATHVIPEGEGVKADLHNHHITRKPMQVLGYGNVRGIDLKHYDPTLANVQAEAAKLRNEGTFTFVYVGRMVRDKGVNELVEAFVRLHAEVSATLLVLVGPYEDDLDPISPEARQGIDSCPAIEAVGRQSDVRPWLAASDAFVLPSYREGFPNVVIEAGAMGKASIVTDINGSREIITDGANGMVVPPRDAESLYQAMRYMADNPEAVTAMADRSRQMIADRYEMGFVHQCLIDFYAQILSKK